jgi:membrane fusion protein (multidrug efflux system)
VKTTDFRDVLPVMGTVKGKTEIELRFEINGVIKKLFFREGEKVKNGDLMASIDNKDTLLKIDYSRSRLNAARSLYNSAAKKLEVNQKLFEAGAIIKSRLEEVALEAESAKYQIETARAEVALAENELNKTNLYANKDGVMGPRDKEEGEFVTPQDKIARLLETGEVLVEVGIVERDIDKVKLGQNAIVYVDAYPNTTFEGKVDSVYPIVEGKSRTLTAKIKIPNEKGLLKPGMFSRAEINICELKDALIVPATALIPAGGTYMLPVIPAKSVTVSPDDVKVGTVELRKTAVGYITSDYAEITSGVEANDFVVIETQGELRDNIEAKIIGIEELTF